MRLLYRLLRAKLPQGALIKAVNEMQPTYTWLTTEMVRGHLRAQSKMQERTRSTDFSRRNNDNHIADSYDSDRRHNDSISRRHNDSERRHNEDSNMAPRCIT